MIEFNLIGGPYSDETSTYNVEFSDGWTVREFVRYVVGDYSIEHGEWGSFNLVDGDSVTRFLHYNRGEEFVRDPWCTGDVCEKILAEYGNRPVVKIIATGGWSSMNYSLWV